MTEKTILLTTKQLAEMLGVSVATIERWRAQGTPELPPHIQLSFGAIRYHPKVVAEWLEKKSTPSEGKGGQT